MGDITKDEMRDRLGNIDQIRDIIFGAQLRDYNGRLDRAESNLSILQQEMRDRTDQIRTSLSSELHAAMESMEKKIKSHNSMLQEENGELRQQLDRLNKKFSTSIEALDGAMDSQTTTLRNELSQTRNKLQDDALALKDLVLEELERRFSMLKDVKVSRDDMAEALFELGMRLKGTEFVPKLQEVAARSEPKDTYTSVPLLETQKHSDHNYSE